MIILAIDPGYERLGIAILEKNSGKEIVLYSDCFITEKTLAHSERLKKLGNEVMRIIDEFHPKALSIEALFFSNNQKTALKVAEARGVILYSAAQKGLEIREFLPADIKIAVTGYGRSDKKQITSMIERIVTITKPIKYDDEYDAIAAGITYFAIVRPIIPNSK